MLRQVGAKLCKTQAECSDPCFIVNSILYKRNTKKGISTMQSISHQEKHINLSHFIYECWHFTPKMSLSFLLVELWVELHISSSLRRLKDTIIDLTRLCLSSALSSPLHSHLHIQFSFSNTNTQTMQIGFLPAKSNWGFPDTLFSLHINTQIATHKLKHADKGRAGTRGSAFFHQHYCFSRNFTWQHGTHTHTL